MPPKPLWTKTLAALMAARGLAPRTLSLMAGLNETAVRDLMEGRAKSPRYDTIKALADVLATTPAYLMGDEGARQDLRKGKIARPDQLDLLTEIITRVMEESEAMRIKLKPKQLGRIASAVFNQVSNLDGELVTKKEINGQISAVLTYERQVIRRR